MQKSLSLFLFLYLIFINSICVAKVEGDSFETVPVQYRGRTVPASSYAKLLFDNYQLQPTSDSTPLEILLQLPTQEKKQLVNTPFFSVKNQDLLALLNLPNNKKLFSFKELTTKIYDSPESIHAILTPLLIQSFWSEYDQTSKRVVELPQILPGLIVELKGDKLTLKKIPKHKLVSQLKIGTTFPLNLNNRTEHRELADHLRLLLTSLDLFEKVMSKDPYVIDYEHLKKEGLLNKEAIKTLDDTFPLIERLTQSSPFLLALPSRQSIENWLPLHALSVQVLNPKTLELSYVKNFTAYSDDLFKDIQTKYLQFVNEKSTDSLQKLRDALFSAYSTITDKPYKETTNKKLYFPTKSQLYLEKIYYQLPFLNLLILGYGASFILFLFANKKRTIIFYSTTTIFLFTFCLHTSLLLIRSYLLGRPPVSNMTETVLFVPWIALLVSFLLAYFYSSYLPLLLASFGSFTLALILKLSEMDTSLENIQAVLDSRFWLTIHVLMIVSSYGAFLLSGLIGHIYLLIPSRKTTSKTKQLLTKLTLQSLYIGLALLIPGTILGGVWAAESWGRFWDWDPKEAWAFITCCAYLVIVHAHYFSLIQGKGVAIGAIIGLMVVAFTWYGVNYILGTGLHSYGFGAGGEQYFYGYLVFELIFLAFNPFYHYNHSNS